MVEIHKKSSNKFQRLINSNAEKIKKSPYGKENYASSFGNEDYIKSLSVSVTTVMEYYKLDSDTAVSALTDGPNDQNIDLLYFDEELIESDNKGNKFLDVVIIQSKYAKALGATGVFSEADIRLCLDSVSKLQNNRLKYNDDSLLGKKLTELHDIQVRNDYPSLRVQVYFATNGVIADSIKQKDCIKEAEKAGVEILFVDATSFGAVMEPPQYATLKLLSDKCLEKAQTSENISGFVTETSLDNLIDFYQQYNETALLDSNVRYLLLKSKINDGIAETAINNPELFWFCNNGISIISDSCTVNSTGTDVFNLTLERPNIINGGQTTAILSKLKKEGRLTTDLLARSRVLIRAYVTKDADIASKIAYTTNSQNPINVVNLKSNNKYQKAVADFFDRKGIALITKPGQDLQDYSGSITNENLLQVYAALYKDDPAKAKNSKISVFNKYFDIVFCEKELKEGIDKKLYRSYFVWDFFKNVSNATEPILKHGLYSLIYAMGQLDKNILNANRPDSDTQVSLENCFKKAKSIIDKIVETKREELKDRFSYNNLFKSNEIKDLIDIAIESEKQDLA